MSTPLTAEDPRLPTLRIRVPAPMLDALDATAAACGTTRSMVGRELLLTALTARGMWPPRGAISR